MNRKVRYKVYAAKEGWTEDQYKNTEKKIVARNSKKTYSKETYNTL